MQRWEYLVVAFQDESIYTVNGKRVLAQHIFKWENKFLELKHKVLNEFGINGWELVTGDPGVYVFKRPKSE
jgi:hypothetical protein